MWYVFAIPAAIIAAAWAYGVSRTSSKNVPISQQPQSQLPTGTGPGTPSQSATLPPGVSPAAAQAAANAAAARGLINIAPPGETPVFKGTGLLPSSQPAAPGVSPELAAALGNGRPPATINDVIAASTAARDAAANALLGQGQNRPETNAALLALESLPTVAQSGTGTPTSSGT